jgi:prolyl-tRNA synthetase
LHGDPAVGLRALGEYAARAGRDVQGDRAQERLFPALHSAQLFRKEAAHVEGFAKECAVVTHSRLEVNAEGKMVPASPLGEPLVVRPTSETIIGATYAKWVQSYRDLPILINQWANVVRWEMRPRVFLRTTEFLWQEGHTVHESEAEAREETKRMLDVYETFVRDHLAVPVFTGEKSESERFPGAVQTLCIEQWCRTAKPSRPARRISWGRTSRGRAASIPDARRQTGVWLDDELGDEHARRRHHHHGARGRRRTRLTAADRADACGHPSDYAEGRDTGRCAGGGGEDCRTATGAKLCRRAHRSRSRQPRSWRRSKNWEWIKKGVPLRVELGPRDLESGNVAVTRRDQPVKSKQFIAAADFVTQAVGLLEQIQQSLLDRARPVPRRKHARHRFKAGLLRVLQREEHLEARDPRRLRAGALGRSREVEEQIKADLKVTIRCIPFTDAPEPAPASSPAGRAGSG